MRLLIMGPPGVGKGTQASAVAAHYEIPWISSGDIFRDNIKRHTPMGERVVDIIGRGDFVPDVVTTGLVFQRLLAPDCRNGWLLDGYPRTPAQVEALDLAMTERRVRLDAVLSRHRLGVYRTETEPLADLYRDRGLLVEVDAEGSIEEVGERILSQLAQRLGR